MGLANISFRTIKRRKSRAALTILCVVIGVAVFSGANVGADGVENAYVTQLLSTFGDVDITIQNSSSLYFINYNQSFLDELSGFNNVEAVTPRIFNPIQNFWFNGTGDNLIALYAIDPELDNEFGEIVPSNIINELKDNKSIINQITADVYNLSKGEIIGFFNPYIPLNQSVEILEVVNFSGKFVIEKTIGIIVMNLQDVQNLLSIPSKASQIEFKIDNYRNIETVMNELESFYGTNFNYFSQKLDALERSSNTVLALRTSLSIFAGISLAVTAILIINVMFMNISDRKRDLGILRSMGASKFQIFSFVLAETIFYGAIGSLIGTISGIIFSTFMLQFLGTAISSIATLSDLILILNPVTLITSFILGLFIVTIAGIYPALSATKISILETIRPRMKGLSKKHLNKKALILGIIFLILGITIPLLIGPDLILTGLFLPTQLGITALITGGLILFFSSILYYVAKGLSILLMFKESKIVIQRNVARNRKRSTLMFTMITIGIVFVIFFSSFAGTFTSTFSGIIRLFTGSDIRLTTGEPVPYNFTSTINSISGISDSSPAYQDITSVDGAPSLTVGLIFIDSEKFLDVFPSIPIVNGPSEEQAFDQLANNNNTIILSNKLMQNQSLTIGDNITLIVTPELGVPTPVEFTIIATTEQFNGYPQYTFDIERLGDTFGAYTDISQLEDLIGVNTVSDFFIKIVPGQDQLTVKNVLEAALSEELTVFTLVSAKEWEIEISSIVEEFTNVVYFFVAFSLVVAAIGLTTTMIVAVSERKQEIGILKSLGMSKNQILKMVLGEGIIITIIGLIVGFGGGLFLWSLFLNTIISSTQDLLFQLPFILPLDIMIILLIASIVIAITASFYPAYKAMKLEIVDAIRKE